MAKSTGVLWDLSAAPWPTSGLSAASACNLAFVISFNSWTVRPWGSLLFAAFPFRPLPLDIDDSDEVDGAVPRGCIPPAAATLSCEGPET